ncbi:TetR/AcrR family transcriptional regulator [Novosphingobium sp. fls2-241-R2A-195]|jgi:AcrR family transcriptional regulator|uniref:TetR/AcrR family transcriptional regulator n=1 Tax=Novosphingobium sp. fls2-241-R2A-195 TaxID=3040296 RepID=UPI0025519ADA|nr:TetR/AcrR family transcriptional regulator [Novosphingobium sp. fls2-241-R2A-195]
MAKNSKPNRLLSDTVSHKAEPLASSRSTHARAVRSGKALQEAMLALLQRKPFDQISVREICSEAKVHYATFFRHHETKEALLNAIAKDQIAHLNQLTLSIRDAESYEAGFEALCAYVADHRGLWAILLNGGAGGAMREEWLRVSMVVAKEEKPINAWLPTQLGTICAASLIAETLAWWVGQPEEAYSVSEIAGILYRLLSTSIMAPD